MRIAILLCLAVLAGCGAPEAPGGKLAVAVLGDSDSHAYHDSVNGVRRGGANNGKTFNWLEVWSALRPAEIDPGPLARAGDHRFVARLKGLVGVPARTPAKLDYLYDYAWSGARCASLTADWPEQARLLSTRLKAEPARWADGLVVIRIGVNDFGQAEHLHVWAQSPEAAAPVVDRCLAVIADAVASIRKHSSAYVALVGVARDYNTPFADETVVADADVPAVEGALARFDAGLQAIAARHPRIAFIEDAGFEARFGSRAHGRLVESVSIGGLTLLNAAGDDAVYAHTADGHPGAVASGLFLQFFIARLNEAFGWRLSVPSDEEIVALAR
ncbi:MAG: hypothetical protein ABL957_15020 [Parvularculaceae bacterium]